MTVIAVLLGGIIGTGLRLALGQVLPNGDTVFPWATLVTNYLGSFVLGFLVARVWPTAPDWLRGGLGTGVIGSLTRAGMPLLAVLYLLVSLAGGLAVAVLGLRLGARPGGPAAPPLEVDE
jgi:CrcB protein